MYFHMTTKMFSVVQWYYPIKVINSVISYANNELIGLEISRSTLLLAVAFQKFMADMSG